MKTVRVVEAAGLLAFGLMVGQAVVSLIGAAPGLLWIPALLLAYFLADLLSGVIHWACDSLGSARTPLWGAIVEPFRRHHREPREITRISLVENLGASALAADVLLLAWRPAVPADASAWGLFWRGVLLGVIVFAVLSNLLHRWSHRPLAQRPPWLRRLQAWHLVLPSGEHLEHHRRPHRVNYCILCGWANPLTNRVPWHRLEAALARVGIKTCFD